MKDENILRLVDGCWHYYFLIAIALSVSRPRGLSAGKRMCHSRCLGAGCAQVWQPAPFEPISQALRGELDHIVCPERHAVGRIETQRIDWSRVPPAAWSQMISLLDRKLRAREPQLRSIAPTDELLRALVADIRAVG